jgi:hypothetical protein
MKKIEVYKWLQSFFGLSVISPDEVSNGFISLMSDAPVHAETFTDYILETFVDENSSFPPYTWVESPSSDPWIKNGPEAFHRDFNSQFYTSHPNCFNIINNVEYILKKYNEFKFENYIRNYLYDIGKLFVRKQIKNS